MGLPQAHRLKNRKDFQSVYQQGVRYSSPHLILRALPPSGESVLPNKETIRTDAERGDAGTRRLDFETQSQILPQLCNVRESSPSLEPATRFGISISQKVSKKAVIRNRIKRQIRAAIRELLPHLSPGWKVVIVVRPPAVECKYEHFLRELKQLLLKAKIVNGHSREYLL